jgi:hypothetical protein
VQEAGHSMCITRTNNINRCFHNLRQDLGAQSGAQSFKANWYSYYLRCQFFSYEPSLKKRKHEFACRKKRAQGNKKQLSAYKVRKLSPSSCIKDEHFLNLGGQDTVMNALKFKDIDSNLFEKRHRLQPVPNKHKSNDMRQMNSGQPMSTVNEQLK